MVLSAAPMTAGMVIGILGEHLERALQKGDGAVRVGAAPATLELHRQTQKSTRSPSTGATGDDVRERINETRQPKDARTALA